MGCDNIWRKTWIDNNYTFTILFEVMALAAASNNNQGLAFFILLIQTARHLMIFETTIFFWKNSFSKTSPN